MAGNPIKRKMVADLCALSVMAGLDEGPNGEQLDHEAAAFAYAIHWIMGGQPEGQSPTVLALARSVGVSRPTLAGWLGEDERREAYSFARKTSAAALVDDASEILDKATPYEAGLANSRANFRKWLASVYDRETFGQQLAVSGSISHAHMHLHAHDVRKLRATEAQGQLHPATPSHTDTPIVMLQAVE